MLHMASQHVLNMRLRCQCHGAARWHRRSQGKMDETRKRLFKKKKKKKKLAVCEGVTVRMAAFVPSSALDKCLFNAPLHNKRLKIPLNIQRLPVPQSSNP